MISKLTPPVLITTFIFFLILGFFDKNPIIIEAQTNLPQIDEDSTRKNIIKERQRTTSNIVVEIKGLNGRNGLLRISLFKDASGFPSSPSNATQTASIEISNDPVVYTFENIEFGEYAISTIQDENRNEKIDTGLFGIPTEKYGFSNNPKINFGPPSFSECKFTLGRMNQYITINLN